MVWLVADENMDATGNGVLARPQALLMRTAWHIFVHPGKNHGCALRSTPFRPCAVVTAALRFPRAATLHIPVSARRALNDLADGLWTKVGIEFYRDPAGAVFKALSG